MPPGVGDNPSLDFTPTNATIVIGVNNTVTWTNGDSAAHTVTPKSQPSGGDWPAAGSSNLAAGQSYTFTFDVPGTYTYICSYHSWMAGGVIVKAAPLIATSTTTSTTPEFPTSLLAAILLIVVAAVAIAAARLRPSGASSARPTVGMA